MLAVVIGALVIISYTSVGGFTAVATMDLIQSVVMTTSLIIVVVYAVNQAGGLEAVDAAANAREGYLKLTESFSAETGGAIPYGPITIVSTLAWGLGYFGMPHILARFMAIRDENEIKYSRRIASVWVVISMGIAIFIGIVGYAVSVTGKIKFLEGSDTERVIVYLADLLATHGVFTAIIGGIILAGILAATMSTADSQLLVAASALSENLIQETFGKKLTEKQNLLVARGTVIGIALVAIFIARDPESSIFQIVSFAWAGFGACFGPAMLLSLYWRRCNRHGVMAGLIVSAVTIFIWKFVVRPLGGAWNIYELLPAFLAGLLTIVIVSLATKEPEKEITDVYDRVHAS